MERREDFYCELFESQQFRHAVLRNVVGTVSSGSTAGQCLKKWAISQGVDEMTGSSEVMTDGEVHKGARTNQGDIHVDVLSDERA